MLLYGNVLRLAQNIFKLGVDNFGLQKNEQLSVEWLSRTA